jgi:hypothetical protein
MNVVKKTCTICDIKYKDNAKARVGREIKCCFCDFSSCNVCCEKFILSQPAEAHCMNPECKKEWPRKFIASEFSTVFLNSTYKQHREIFLFEMEKAKLPETQIHVQRILEEERIREDKNRKWEEMRILRKEIDDLTIALSRVRIALNDEVTSGIIKTNNTVKFMCRCPDEDCRGFVSSDWKCGMCKKRCCSSCHESKEDGEDGEDLDDEEKKEEEGKNNEEKEEEGSRPARREGRELMRGRRHVCNPDIVANVALLKSDTKDCPGCHAQITKLDGCSQMWCVVCHTAFCWKTGVIELKIHNPHYYEWMRRNSQNGEIPREIGDNNNCGMHAMAPREITHQTSNTINQIFNRRHRKTPGDKRLRLALAVVPDVVCVVDEKEDEMSFVQSAVIDFIRKFLHFKLVTIQNHIGTEQNNNRAYEREKLSLRVSYLRSMICENTFKLNVQRRNKHRQKIREYRDVYDMYIDATTDIIYRFIENINTCEYGSIDYSILEEMSNLIDYTNENIQIIGLTYTSKPILIEKTIFYYRENLIFEV